jgi:hypothetical protein
LLMSDSDILFCGPIGRPLPWLLSLLSIFYTGSGASSVDTLWCY